MIILKLNFLAVLAAVVASGAIGSLWYSKLLFGKEWMKLRNIKPSKKKSAEKAMVKARVFGLLVAIVTALGLAILIKYNDITMLLSGIKLGLLVWFGFIASFGFYEVAYGNRNIKLYLIDMGYQFFNFLVMSIILTLWR